MIEYKYTRHIWTRDTDFLLHAERTLAYMAYSSSSRPFVEPLLNTYTDIDEYNLLDTPQKRFGYLIARLLERSVEYFSVTDPDLWAYVHLPHHTVIGPVTTTETIARLMFLFHHSLYLSEMTTVAASYAGSDRKYVIMEGDPVRMFMNPMAYTLDGMSATMHSQVFGGDGTVFVPWDGTEGIAWLVDGFHFELFTLIAESLKTCTFLSPPIQQHI